MHLPSSPPLPFTPFSLILYMFIVFASPYPWTQLMYLLRILTCSFSLSFEPCPPQPRANCVLGVFLLPSQHPLSPMRPTHLPLSWTSWCSPWALWCLIPLDSAYSVPSVFFFFKQHIYLIYLFILVLKYLFILFTFLSASGLSCGTQGLRWGTRDLLVAVQALCCGMQTSLWLWHAGSQSVWAL